MLTIRVALLALLARQRYPKQLHLFLRTALLDQNVKNLRNGVLFSSVTVIRRRPPKFGGKVTPTQMLQKSGRQSKIILVSNHKVSGTFWDYIWISVKSEWHFVRSASAVFEGRDNYVMIEVSNHSQSEWHFFRLQRDFCQKWVALCELRLCRVWRTR